MWAPARGGGRGTKRPSFLRVSGAGKHAGACPLHRDTKRVPVSGHEPMSTAVSGHHDPPPIEEALEKGEVAQAAAMFDADSYWRDLVAFTWNIKTCEGQAAIADMLGTVLAGVQ